MTIIHDSEYIQQLFNILRMIHKDKPSITKKFEQELNERLELLKLNPYMCRQSNYFDDKLYRDLIYFGYTVIYKIEHEKILILEIFKWQDR